MPSIKETPEVLYERMMAVIINIEAIARLTSGKPGEPNKVAAKIDKLLENPQAIEREKGVIGYKRYLLDMLAEAKREILDKELNMRTVNLECEKIQNKLIRTKEKSDPYS